MAARTLWPAPPSRRPSRPPRPSWGSARSRSWRSWFWQSFPGIGTELANRLADQWDRLPFRLDIPVEVLRSVPGLGKKRVAEILELLGEDPDLPPPPCADRDPLLDILA